MTPMRGTRLAKAARAAALGAVAALLVAAAWSGPARAAAHAQAGGFIPSSEDVGYQTGETPLFDRWGTCVFEIRYPTRVLPTVRHPVAAFDNSLANIFLGFAQVLARFGVFLFQVGLKTTVATDALGAVAGTVGGLKERVFFPLLPLALLAVAAYAAWQGVVQRGHSEVARTLLLVALVFGVGLYFMGNVQAVVGGACGAMDRMAAYLTAALAAPGQAARGGDPDSVVMLGCEKLWAVAVQNPWAWGTYGKPDYPGPALVSEAEAEALAARGSGEGAGAGAGGILPQALPQISAEVGAPWTELFSRYAAGTDGRDALVDVLGDPRLDHGDHAGSPDALSIAGALTQVVLGVVALVTSALVLAVAALYGGGMLLAQVMVVVLTVIAPVAFLYGLTPAGFGTLKKWAFMLAGAVITRFVYAGALGLLFLLVSAVETAAAGPGGRPTPASAFVSGAMVAALLVGAVVLRGRLVNGALGPLVAASGVQAWQRAGGGALSPGAAFKGAWEAAARGADAEAERARRAAGTARAAGGMAGSFAGVPVTSEQQVAQAADELMAWRLAQSRARYEAAGERDALLEEAELRQQQGLGPLSEARRAQAREEVRRLVEVEGLSPGEAAAYLRARGDVAFERSFLGRAGAQAGRPSSGGETGAEGDAEAAAAGGSERARPGGQPGAGIEGRRARRREQFEEARQRAQEYARQYASAHSWRATRPAPRAYRGVRDAASSALGWFRRRFGRA